MDVTSNKKELGMKWEMVKLGEMALTSSGGTPNRSVNKYWINGNIPWIKSGQLKDCVIETAEEYISEEGLKNSSTKIFKKGTLLLALYGATAGKLGFLGLDAATNQAICSIVPKKEILHAKYLYYYLLSIRDEIIADSTGGAQPNISQAYVKELQIPLPPLPAQKRIAEILDAADALRRKDQELLKKYDELAQAIFIDMFGDPVRNEKGWEVKKLKDVTSKIGSGATPTGGKTAYKESGITLIRSMNVYDFSFKMKDLAFIDTIQAAKLNNVEVKSKDVLFNITGASVCRCSIVPDELLPARVNQHVAIIRPISNYMNPVFLNHLLVSDRVKGKLLSVGAGGGAVMEAITKDQLGNFEVIIPNIEVQNRFEEIISLVFKKKSNHLRVELKTDCLFQTLIHKAFKGEL